MCSDYMLRHLVIYSPKHSYADVYVRFAATNSVLNLNLSDIATSIKDDKTMQTMIRSVKRN